MEKEYFFQTRVSKDSNSDYYGHKESKDVIIITLYKADIERNFFGGKYRVNICAIASRRVSKDKADIEKAVEELKANASYYDEEYEREQSLKRQEMERRRQAAQLQYEKEQALSNLLSSVNSQSFTKDGKII